MDSCLVIREGAVFWAQMSTPVRFQLRRFRGTSTRSSRIFLRLSSLSLSVRTFLTMKANLSVTFSAKTCFAKTNRIALKKTVNLVDIPTATWEANEQNLVQLRAMQMKMKMNRRSVIGCCDRRTARYPMRSSRSMQANRNAPRFAHFWVVRSKQCNRSSLKLLPSPSNFVLQIFQPLASG